MNENEILDNLNIEDLNLDVETEDLEQTSNKDVEEDISKDDELDIEISEVKESETIDDSLDVDITLQDDASTYDLNTNVIEDAPVEEEEENSSIEEIETSVDEGSIKDDADILAMNEEETEECIKLEELEVKEDIEETVQELNTDENIITDDLNNIKIEFGIEAKGFILSIAMMEAMIQKGYVFKDILNDKTFDAVMIFNDNLENTVMTNDIKIKIENGKIQLIKA